MLSSAPFMLTLPSVFRNITYNPNFLWGGGVWGRGGGGLLKGK